MTEKVKAVLITGPAGGGKSTLAKALAERLDWKCISEDDFWVAHDWSGLRTPEQERIIQEQVFAELQSLHERDQGVVLEFILYKEPPNPLSAYQGWLAEHHIPFDTIVLKPTVEVILQRIHQRGRPHDLENMEAVRVNAERQVTLLEAEFIDPRWVISPENVSVDALGNKCVERVQV